MSSNQILLGIRDSEIGEETNWMTNKIGGKADWMPACTDLPNLKCILCNQEMVLVVQLYCPLGNSSYDRTLYVFCCINQSCWNKQQSWQVYRNQHLFQNEHCISESNTCTNTEDQKQSWLSDELDWEDEMTNSDKVSNNILYITKEIADLHATDKNYDLNSSDQNESLKLGMNTKMVDSFKEIGKELLWNTSNFIPKESNLSFRSYYVNVIDEPNTTELDMDPHVQRLLNAYHIHEESEISPIQDGGNSNIQSEKYEKDWVKHGDNLFHKFAKRVARCQNQIIRYCWGGQPLLISKLDQNLPTSCQKCNGPLIFEFQLMPALIKMLKLPNYEDTPVEFGTVIIMTCQQSCWKDETSFCTESIYLQSDPDESFFQQMN